MRVRLLGPVDVEVDAGQVVEIGATKVRRVLAALAAARGRVVHHDTLVEAVWPSGAPATAAKTLQTYVWAVRRSLGSDAIVTDGPHYRLGPHVSLDADDFEAAVEGATASGDDDAIDALDGALSMWRGSALVDVLDWPLAHAEAVRLEELRCYAEELRSSAMVRSRPAGAVVGELESLAMSEPLRERRWELLVSSLIGAGRPGEAVRAVQRAREHLAESGLRLGVELARLELVALGAEPSSDVVATPARSGGGMPATTLPPLLSSFVGRQVETTEVTKLVLSHRLVTLTGSGGVGKTRLAHRVASNLFDRYARDVWWIDLAPATSTDAMLAAVAEGMGTTLSPGTDPESQLVKRVARDRATLLVLDNSEHLIDSVVPLASRLLATCPSLSVIATSREPLGLPGEHVWRVPSLGSPAPGRAVTATDAGSFDAVTLFVERHQQAVSRFVLDDSAARSVVVICSRLDGIPLAIELAAARARTLPLDILAERLDDAFGLLTGGPRTALERHQTLHASITWSYQLLDAPCQAILRRLAVCPTYFDVQSAEAITADDETVATADVLDGLATLVDKSLVMFDEATGRYRILETIRQYGLERLAAEDELDATLRRHALCWAARAHRLGAFEGFDSSSLRGALTDLLMMLDWAMAHDGELADQVLASTGVTMYGLGRWTDLHRACDWVVADRPRGVHWAGAFAAVATNASYINRFDVLGLTAEAMERATAAQDSRTMWLLRVGPAIGDIISGDFATARELRDEAVAAGDHVGALMVVTWLVPLGPLGHLEELRALHVLGEELCTRVGQLAADNTIGPMGLYVEHLSGELTAAKARIPEPSPRWSMVSCLWATAAAGLAIDLDDDDCARRALALVDDDGGLPVTTPLARIAEWASAIVARDVERALAKIDDAVVAGYMPVTRLVAVVNAAATYAWLGRWDEALQAATQGDAIMSRFPERSPRPSAVLSLVRGRAAIAAMDLGTARTAVECAVSVSVDNGLRLLTIDAVEATASICAASNDHVTAARLAAAATAERQRIGYRGRLTSGLSAALSDELISDDPVAGDHGSQLTLDQSVVLARKFLAGMAERSRDEAAPSRSP